MSRAQARTTQTTPIAVDSARPPSTRIGIDVVITFYLIEPVNMYKHIHISKMRAQARCTHHSWAQACSVQSVHCLQTPSKAWLIWWCNQMRFGKWLCTLYLGLLAHFVETQPAPCWHSSRNYCSNTACLTPPKDAMKPGLHCKPPMVSYRHTCCPLVGHHMLVSFWVQAWIRFWIFYGPGVGWSVE